MKIAVIKHISEEAFGFAEMWAIEHGHILRHLYFNESAKPALTDDFDILWVMGGIMGAYDVDKFPWLGEEKRLLAQIINSGKPVLGICLGAQLIADATGGRAYRNSHTELGFHRIIPANGGSTLLGIKPEGENFFQWHSDTFDLPPDAELLATGDNVRNQAFRIKNTIALQFHPEMNEAIITDLFRREYAREKPSPWMHTHDQVAADIPAAIPRAKAFLYSLLDKMAGGDY